MEEGEYSFEITDDSGTQIQKVTYTSSTEEATTVAKAVHITKLQDGKYLMSAETKGKINVQIFDGENNLIHDKNFAVDGKFAVVYNLKDVQGQPNFLVK
jgi:hypothetical protein